MRCTYSVSSARVILLRLQVELAGDDLSAAEVDQREHHVIAGGETRGQIDRELADRTRQTGEFRNRHLRRKRVVGPAEFEVSLGDEMHAAAVAEANRDLSLRWRDLFDRHVFDRRISLESGGRDVDFHARAEDVLKRIAAGAAALRNFFDEENIPAFLAKRRCVLHGEADEARRPRLDAYRCW